MRFAIDGPAGTSTLGRYRDRNSKTITGANCCCGLSKVQDYTFRHHDVDTNKHVGCQVVNNVDFSFDHSDALSCVEEELNLSVFASVMFLVSYTSDVHWRWHLLDNCILHLPEEELSVNQTHSTAGVQAEAIEFAV